MFMQRDGFHFNFYHMYTVFSILDLCGLIPHQAVNILAIKRQTIEIVMTTTVLAILFVRFFSTFLSFFGFYFHRNFSYLVYFLAVYAQAHRSVVCVEKTKSGSNYVESSRVSTYIRKKIRGRARSFQIIWKQWRKNRFITCVSRLHICGRNGELVFRVKCVARRNKWICWWQYTMHSTVNNND